MSQLATSTSSSEPQPRGERSLSEPPASVRRRIEQRPASSAWGQTRLTRARRFVTRFLEEAGIAIDGPAPHDVRVNSDEFYLSAFKSGTTGLREAYVNGFCDVERLDVATYRVLERHRRLPRASRAVELAWNAYCRLINLQRGARGLDVSRHYDLGNDLFQRMLDRRLCYSCGYWQDATSLDQAQEAKLDLVCRKLKLNAGMRVLDIGCGFGSLAQFAAERYGCSVVGITISREQAELARRRCVGLPVEIRLQDYRDLGAREKFDAIASIGMFEHVGLKNYRNFFEIVRRALEPSSLCLLHTIGSNASGRSYDPWMHRYIFPNAHLPSAAQICKAADGLLLLEDWHGFGQYYDPTLMAWWANFERGWPELRPRYGERFYRLWKCYLQTSAGSFRARYEQVWQIIFSDRGVPGGYVPIR